MLKTILELGSGANPTLLVDDTDPSGFCTVRIVHIDRVEGPHVELVCDLNHGIPLPANTVDEILALDVLEHLDNLVAIMDEMHRVLIPDGFACIRVPKWGSYEHTADPTHKRGFIEQSFDFFDDSTEFGKANGALYTKRRWKIVQMDYNQSGGSLCFELHALKPGEHPKEWGL